MVMDHIAPTAAPWVCSIADTLPQPFALGDLLLAVQRPEEADTATDGDGVFVGTAHSAKGKEWDCVFVAGMEAEAWERKGEDTEAERRLAYVAVTRAKSRVVVSWCRSRPHPFKTWQQEPKTRSRFVGELMGGAA
jgi:DNA helicase-2/ATP-dependent DNA helicase PcrA